MKLKSLGVGFFALCTFAFALAYIYTAHAEIIEFTFDTWKIGQGTENSKTFITDNETSCQITAEVDFTANGYLIDGPDWNVTGTHGFTFARGNNTFEYQDKGTGNTHGSGRNTPIAVMMRVKVKMGSDQQTLIKHINQDEKDQIRQEYIDHGISVPARSKFGRDRGDAYDKQDDYRYAIHEPARSNLAAWSEEFGHTIAISSGYRNPEYNVHNVGGSPTSNHQYGIAIDGLIRDYDGDGSTEDDRQEMYDAARDLGLDPLPKDRYRSHIHIGG